MKSVINVVLDGTAAAVIKQVVHTFVPGGDYTGVRVSKIVPLLTFPAEGISDSQTKNNALFVWVGYGNQTSKGNDTLDELLVGQSVIAISQLTIPQVGTTLNTSNVVTGHSLTTNTNVMTVNQDLIVSGFDVITDLSFGVVSLSTLADIQNFEVRFVVEWEPIKITDKSYLKVTQLERIQ